MERKKRSFEVLNCILLEKLRAWLRSVWSFWNFWNKEAQFEFLSLFEGKRKILKFFELYFGNYCIFGKIEGIVEVCEESFWNFWNKEAQFEFLFLFERKWKV